MMMIDDGGGKGERGKGGTGEGGNGGRVDQVWYGL